MERVVLIKYGELTTKKGNRKFFINTLYQNIKKKLTGLNVKISRDISRMYIEFSDNEIDLVLYFRSPDASDDDKNGNTILRLCDVHTIPVATNIATAEVLIHGLERGDLDWRDIVNPTKM